MRRYWGAVVILVACWQTSTSPTSPTSINPRHAPGASVASRSEFLAAWGDDRGTSPQGKHQVYATRISDDGMIVDPTGIAIDTRPHRGRPTALVSPPGNSSQLFVCEKTGSIRVIPDVTAAAPASLNVLTLAGVTTSSEQGVLGRHPAQRLEVGRQLLASASPRGAREGIRIRTRLGIEEF